MRIRSIEASNFKSLVDFRLDLAKFNCLIGLNGSGKSTVLQFIDFVAQLVRGDMKDWLSERKWKSTDLRSKVSKKVNVDFCVFFSDDSGKPTGRWEASYSPSKNRCTRERIDLFDYILEVTKDTLHIFGGGDPKSRGWRDSTSEITFTYQGSILSALKEDLLPQSILKCKQFLLEVRSLDLLAPEYLKQKTRESTGTLGLGGQNLSAFVHAMSDQKRLELVAKLKQAYPQLQGLSAKSIRSGWKQLEISESYVGQESGFFPMMTTESRHINDGMLRLIAILAELQGPDQVLLFDEIENGINPELVEFVLDSLVSARQQVLVTTHSPLILNYLNDEVAKLGVVYLYKTRSGATQAMQFFSIPSLAKKLAVMGPGEAFVDTNLTLLCDEIEQMTEGQ